ncbi:ankyrin repeat protein [Colletotrichum tofieldiae]|nr:ankyrin repeat protein [Colletotrichum tofieldiae]
MDAQNAAGSDKPKPVAAAEKRPGNHQPDEPKEPKESNNKPAKVADESIKSPPHLPKDIKPSVTVSRAPPAADDAPADRDSDAETIVLPGKDGHSPSKRWRAPGPPALRKIRDASASRDGDKEKAAYPPRLSETASSLGLKKKRLHDQSVRSKDGSSGLSSAPTSPPHHRRRSGGHSDSDTGADRRKSPKLPMKDRAKSTDRTIPTNAKLPGQTRMTRRKIERPDGNASSRITTAASNLVRTACPENQSPRLHPRGNTTATQDHAPDPYLPTTHVPTGGVLRRSFLQTPLMA